MRAAGHGRTILTELAWRLYPPRPPAAERVTIAIDDPDVGRVRLRALLGGNRHARTLLVIVPGLTGNADSPYLVRAVRAAELAGLAHLRVGMRGTDRDGEDLWHGGLTADLHATLADPRLAHFESLVVLGYSVGGHATLCAASESIDPRVRAVASLCAPLDLDAGTLEFDRPELALYRRSIHAALDEIYTAVYARRRLPVAVDVVRRARSCRERDALAIAPRHGFASAEDYYARASAAPRLPHLRVPSLIVATHGDPIVPPHTLHAALESAGANARVHWTEGGHLAFPDPIEPSILAWLKDPS